MCILRASHEPLHVGTRSDWLNLVRRNNARSDWLKVVRNETVFFSKYIEMYHVWRIVCHEQIQRVFYQ